MEQERAGNFLRRARARRQMKRGSKLESSTPRARRTGGAAVARWRMTNLVATMAADVDVDQLVVRRRANVGHVGQSGTRSPRPTSALRLGPVVGGAAVGVAGHAPSIRSCNPTAFAGCPTVRELDAGCASAQRVEGSVGVWPRCSCYCHIYSLQHLLTSIQRAPGTIAMSRGRMLATRSSWGPAELPGEAGRRL